ncbi:MAG: hypothetical protein AMJ43_07275 [Coxiella sp. DG_40]|nr:MAG: hypothetical protein AMJ43_07275 [Coxiella sp. DG_40]
MKVLVVTNTYPTKKWPSMGIFVKEQVESLEKEGIEIDVLFINGWESKLNYLWGILRLWKCLLTHRYDLVHAHYVFSGIIARCQFLYPVVLTHHGIEVFLTWQRVPSRLITYLVDKTIVVSQQQKEKLRYKNMVVIPCGIDFDLFRPMSREEVRQELNLPPEKKLVSCVGHYSRPEKRFDIIQAALTLAQEKDPSIELVLVRNQTHDIVPLYMNACDVILLVSDGEGSPMVIKEAMACNLPIVSVPVGDVPEIIKDTEGCYLCTQDPEDVAVKLLLALSNGKRTEGREKIKHMELSQISRKIIAQYQEVLHNKKPHIPFWLRKRTNPKV